MLSFVDFCLKRAAFFALVAGVAFVAGESRADVTLSPSGDDDTAALAAAISAANAGDVITLEEGTFLLSGTFTLDKGVTLKGASRDGTILDFQRNCQGFIVSDADAVLRDLTVTQGLLKAVNSTKLYGAAIWLQNGLVENCLITDSEAYCASGTSYYVYGGGVAMSGGTLRNCEITRCVVGKTKGAKTCIANALYMTGGTAVGCDIHHNDGGYTSTSSASSASAVVYINSGSLLNSKIRENAKGGVPGIFQQGGTVANCLIYGNTGSKYGGGLYKTSGYTYYCTIWGNVMEGDSTGVSGAYVSGGTMQNCILVGNGPATSTAGSINVTGSSATVQNCVLDKELATSAKIKDNTVNANVQFAAAANGDFTIASLASPACGRAVPLADYPLDFAGTARDAAAPTAGAYEFVQQTGVFAVDFAFDRPDHVFGEEVTATAFPVGATTNEVTFAWYVDGAIIAGAKEGVLKLTPELGRHAVKVVATKNAGGEWAEKEYADALDIRPTTCYVNETGSGTYPYATPETATNSLNEAMATVWTDADEKARVLVADGIYRLDAQIALRKPIELIGAGRDETIVADFTSRAIMVAHAQAVVSGITVSNCQSAFSISSGLIRDCRALDIGGTSNSNGGGFYVEGGRVENCEAINCRETFLSPFVNTFCSGAGLNISGGVVSNFLCRGCIIRPAENGRNARGGSVYASGGTLIDATIEDSCRDADTTHDYFGANIYGSNCTLERCRFTGMRTGAGIGTRLSNVKATSCLFADNVLTKSYTNFLAIGCALVNCTIASNSNENVSVYLCNCAVTNTIVAANGSGEEILDGGTYAYSCAAGLADGVDGNVVADPLFRSVEKADFSLLPSSPCVDAALRQDWMRDATDILGNRRVSGPAPDMGCFESFVRGTVFRLY